MLKRFAWVVLLGACASSPPVKISTPEEYQNVVAELVAQVIDAFKTDGTNCDMLHDDLRGVKGSNKFKAAHDWGTQHPDGPKLAQEKIDARKADYETAAAPAIRACGNDLEAAMKALTK